MSRAAARDERGLVLSSWLVAASAVVVALAVVGFAVSGDRDPEVTDAAVSAPAVGPDGEAGTGGAEDRPASGEQRGGEEADQNAARPERDPVARRTAYVEVYNNSGIAGLADGTAASLQDTGWRVVVTDNWYGEIPANTVYHPAALAGQAELLAGDLGIDRVQPAVAPMAFDRLTVILVTGA